MPSAGPPALRSPSHRQRSVGLARVFFADQARITGTAGLLRALQIGGNAAVSTWLRVATDLAALVGRDALFGGFGVGTARRGLGVIVVATAPEREAAGQQQQRQPAAGTAA